MNDHFWKRDRDLIEKIDEVSDPQYGHPPDERSMEDHLKYGVINLDKPSGPSSHEVTAWVKKILHVPRAGHGGTLDPKVTGVLPIALQEATKVIGTLLHSGKEYVCVMRLHSDLPEQKVREVMNEFVGDILQRPPLRSSVRRRVRLRRVYYINDIEFKGRRVLFRIGCQAGTYIRKIVHDMGEILGPGAHMEELRRTRVGPFTEEERFASLYMVQEGYDLWIEKKDESILREVVMPIEKVVTMLPKIYIRDSAVSSICHGANLAIPGIAKLETGVTTKDIVGIFSLKGELVAIGRAVMSSEEMTARDRGIAVDTERVVMKLDEYPKMWKSRRAV
jgi:H/ACA ribonucleoprotein complex subunit 4